MTLTYTGIYDMLLGLSWQKWELQIWIEIKSKTIEMISLIFTSHIDENLFAGRFIRSTTWFTRSIIQDLWWWFNKNLLQNCQFNSSVIQFFDIDHLKSVFCEYHLKHSTGSLFSLTRCCAHHLATLIYVRSTMIEFLWCLWCDYDIFYLFLWHESSTQAQWWWEI